MFVRYIILYVFSANNLETQFQKIQQKIYHFRWHRNHHGFNNEPSDWPEDVRQCLIGWRASRASHMHIINWSIAAGLRRNRKLLWCCHLQSLRHRLLYVSRQSSSSIPSHPLFTEHGLSYLPPPPYEWTLPETRTGYLWLWNSIGKDQSTHKYTHSKLFKLLIVHRSYYGIKYILLQMDKIIQLLWLQCLG